MKYLVNQIKKSSKQFRYFFYSHMPSFLYPWTLKRWYYKRTKRKLNLHNPETFNDKIQWSKLYDSTPIKTKLADKYAVRAWVKEKIGEEYLIPLLGVYDKFEDIPFDTLPEQFVIKCNHGSGYNIIVKSKASLDYKEIKRKLDNWLKEDFAFRSLELHYLGIKRRILIEQYISDETGELNDYKFLCFDGKPAFIWVDVSRYTSHKRNVYDTNWNLLPYKFHTYDSCPGVPKPITLSKMLYLAAVLSKDFNFVRVDFYQAHGHVFFGEITFTSSSGAEQISSAQFDSILSSKFKLPEEAYNIKTKRYYKFHFKNKE